MRASDRPRTEASLPRNPGPSGSSVRYSGALGTALRSIVVPWTPDAAGARRAGAAEPSRKTAAAEAAIAARTRRPVGDMAPSLFFLLDRRDPVLDELLGAARALIDQGLEDRLEVVIGERPDDHPVVDDHGRRRADAEGELLGGLLELGPRVDDLLHELAEGRVVRGALGAVLLGQGGAPGRVLAGGEVGPDLVVDLGEAGQVAGGDVGQLARAGVEVRLLRDDRVARAVEREELDGHVDLAGEFLLELLDLLAEVEAVRAHEVGVFDDMDGRVLERLGRSHRPVGREERRRGDLGELEELFDDVDRRAGLGGLAGVVIFDHAVGPGGGDDGEDDEEIERRPDPALDRALDAAVDAVDGEEDEAHDREEIKARAEKAEAAEMEDGVKEERDDAGDVEERERFVGPLEGL